MNIKEALIDNLVKHRNSEASFHGNFLSLLPCCLTEEFNIRK